MKQRLRGERLTQPPVDLFPMARFHRCLPWFSPGELQPQDRSCWYARMADYLRLNRELQTLLQTFEQSGIRCRSFKGPVWKDILSPELLFRQCTDMDVLVDSRQIPRVLTMLQDLGYCNDYDLSFEQVQRLVAHVFSMEFRHAQNGFILDLHWDLTEGYCLAPFTNRETQPDVNAFDNSLQTFDDSLILFLILMHGAKNNYETFIYAADLFCWMSQHPDWDWGRTVRRYRSAGLVRFLTVGLGLTHSMLDAPLPTQVQRALDKDRTAVHLINQIRTRFESGLLNRHSRAEALRFQYQIRRGFRQILYYSWFRLTPKKADWIKNPDSTAWAAMLTRMKRTSQSVRMSQNSTGS